MKSFMRFLLGLFAPLILVFGGAGLAGLGAEYDFDALIWAGGIAIVSGLLWGCWILLLADSGTWWD